MGHTGPRSSPILARVADSGGATQFTALSGGVIQEARLAHPADAAFGVRFESADRDDEHERGPMIAEVIPHGGAERAGLLPGDRIGSVDDEAVESVADFREAVGAALDSPALRVTVTRRDEPVAVEVTLNANRDAVVEVVDLTGFPTHVDVLWTGLEVVELDDATRRRIGSADAPARGLVVTSVAPGGGGYRAGLRRGDRLIEFDGVETTTVDAWRRQLRGLHEGRSASFCAESTSGEVEGTIPLVLQQRRAFADVPVALRYAKGVDGTSLHLGSVLFGYESTYRPTQARDPAKDVEVSWLLGLIRWRRTEHERQLRLFWLIPISF